ncbi:MAG: DUF3368 domain-containing protein [Planctomycetota bacterium]
MGEICVVNASPLIFLGAARKLHLLKLAGERFLVPEKVLDELMAHGPSDPACVAVREAAWIERTPTGAQHASVVPWDLGPGETAVLSLALATPGSRVVLDDLQARKCAESLGVAAFGTLGLVLLAKRRGEIPSARALLTELREHGMWLSDRVLDRALEEVGEA